MTFTNDKGGLLYMLKDFAWNIFMRFGIVDSYIFYREIEERNEAEEQRKTGVAEVAPRQA